jgi:hypothetical protein
VSLTERSRFSWCVGRILEHEGGLVNDPRDPAGPTNFGISQRDHPLLDSRGVPDDAKPGPGRWSLVGTGFDDLTLDGDGGSRSVLLLGGCAWHGFVTNGEVT